MRPTLTSEEFYRRRDDRTNRVTDNREYHNFHVRLVTAEGALNSFSGQIQLILVANMLSRWCRRIDLAFPDVTLHPRLRIGSWATIHQRILSEMHRADPFGSFLAVSDLNSPSQYSMGIGQVDPESVNFVIDSNGWEACAGRELSPRSRVEDENIIGPAFAACLGVADAFKVASGQPDESRVRSLRISLWDNSSRPYSGSVFVPEKIDLGNVLLIGAGSVGSAIVYLLHMLPITGRLTLIDHDIVEIENLNRSPLFGIENVNESKVAVCQRYLKNRISVDAFPGKYNEFIQKFGRKPGTVDLILPEANEYGARSYIENNFPPLQIYGTTTTSWGINYHRHMPLDDEDCSLCRFPPTTHPKMTCSINKVETESGRSIDAALPFLSMGAAILTVADLIRLQLPGYPQVPNFAYFDFKDKLEMIISYKRHQKPGCSCSSRSQQVHKEYNQSTKFFS